MGMCGDGSQLFVVVICLFFEKVIDTDEAQI
jgi:hypothetical protein